MHYRRREQDCTLMTEDAMYLLFAYVQVDALLKHFDMKGTSDAVRLDDHSTVNLELLLQVLQAFDDGSISSMQHTGLKQAQTVIPGAADNTYLQSLQPAAKLNAVSTVYHAKIPTVVEQLAERVSELEELQQVDMAAVAGRQQLLKLLAKHNVSHFVTEELRAAFLSENTVLDDIFIAIGHCAREGLREFWESDTKTGLAIVLLRQARVIGPLALAVNASLGGCKGMCKSLDADDCYCWPADSYSTNAQRARSLVLSALLRAAVAVSSSVRMVNFSGTSGDWWPRSTTECAVKVCGNLRMICITCHICTDLLLCNA
jgi:hypothetical protein